MSVPYFLNPESQAEYDDACDYYHAIRPDLADAFEAEAAAAFASLSANPRIGYEVAPGVRRVKFRKLSYVVFYREDAALIEIISVFHTSRDPADWQGRV